MLYYKKFALNIFSGLLNGASQKTEVVAVFHAGETVTWLQRATLIPGGSEALLYATLSGALGALLPFTSREDHDFFQHLEMHMRSENSPLCGRDHLSFRSYYYPVKVCIYFLLAFSTDCLIDLIKLNTYVPQCSQQLLVSMTIFALCLW